MWWWWWWWWEMSHRSCLLNSHKSVYCQRGRYATNHIWESLITDSSLCDLALKQHSMIFINIFFNENVPSKGVINPKHLIPARISCVSGHIESLKLLRYWNSKRKSVSGLDKVLHRSLACVSAVNLRTGWNLWTRAWEGQRAATTGFWALCTQ